LPTNINLVSQNECTLDLNWNADTAEILDLDSIINNLFYPEEALQRINSLSNPDYSSKDFHFYIADDLRLSMGIATIGDDGMHLSASFVNYIRTASPEDIQALHKDTYDTLASGVQNPGASKLIQSKQVKKLGITHNTTSTRTSIAKAATVTIASLSRSADELFGYGTSSGGRYMGDKRGPSKLFTNGTVHTKH